MIKPTDKKHYLIAGVFLSILLAIISVTVFMLNKENGLPIKSWFVDKNDWDLRRITPILDTLSKVDDVRNYIKKVVENNNILYENTHLLHDTYIELEGGKNTEKATIARNKTAKVSGNDNIKL